MQFGYARAEDLMAAIGSGEITAGQISFRLLEAEHKAAERRNWKPMFNALTRPVQAEGMRIDETGGLLVTLARCCNPMHGDEITGFITRGKGVTVHRADCKNILNTTEPERIINVTWPPANGQSFPSRC